MTDLHSHYLPGLDDGSGSMEQSLRMLRLAWGEGIAAAFTTPHLMADGSEERYREKADRTFRQLKARSEAELPGLRLWLGFEMLLGEGLFDLKAPEKYALGDSGHLLLETWDRQPYPLLLDAADWLGRRGITPVLAHPERNPALCGDEEQLGKLIQMGVKLQINTSSIDGQGFAIKLRTKRLAKRGWVSFLGTDAHGDVRRPPRASAAVDVLSKWIGMEQALRIARAQSLTVT